jgi:hypothetical protein
LTQVLTFVCWEFVVQVADRRISRQQRNQLSVFDDIANKLLIHKGTDAIVAIGYAGSAYARGIPTDERIAAILSGRELPIRSGNGWITLGGIPVTDIGTSVHRIGRELRKIVPINGRIEVCVAGFRTKLGRPVRPVFYDMEITAAAAKYAPAGFQMPLNECRIQTMGLPLTRSQFEYVRRKIFEADPRPTALKIANIFAEAIRLCGDTGVGEHASAIIVHNPKLERRVESWFLPNYPHKAVFAWPSEQVIELDFHPWIVSPGALKPPSAEVGGGKFGIGEGFEVECLSDSKKPESGLLSVMTTVPIKPFK